YLRRITANDISYLGVDIIAIIPSMHLDVEFRYRRQIQVQNIGTWCKKLRLSFRRDDERGQTLMRGQHGTGEIKEVFTGSDHDRVNSIGLRDLLGALQALFINFRCKRRQ